MHEIERMLRNALNSLYQNDKYLICHQNDNDEDTHLCERCIAFRFGIYFQAQLNESDKNKDYNLDCEYNRRINDSKIIPISENGIYPDFILHKRGTNAHNVLVVELKGWWNSNLCRDEKKIRELINPNGEYGYRKGYVVLFEKHKADLKEVKFFDSQKSEH